MFLYIGWQDSLEFHPFNRPNDFIVDLPKNLLLEGKWEVALTDIKVKSPNKSTFYVLGAEYKIEYSRSKLKTLPIERYRVYLVPKEKICGYPKVTIRLN